MAVPVKVFVSYSWGVEDKTKIVDALAVQCRERGIQLIRDSSTMNQGDRISKFMGRIKDASHVITVFSKAYFESKYCLYEWRELLQYKGFEQKIYPVLADGLKVSDSVVRREFIDFWGNHAEKEEEEISKSVKPGAGSDQHEDLKLYKMFHLDVDRLMVRAGDLLATQAEVLKKNQYASILDLIRPQFQIPPEAIFKPHQSDQDFMAVIKARLKDELDASDTLRKAIAKEIEVKGNDENSSNLANILISRCENDLDELLRDHVTNAVANALQALSRRPDNDSPLVIQEVQQLTSSADALFSCLVLCAICDDWMKEYQQKRGISASNLAHMPFHAAAAVEIVTSRHLQRLPRFKLNSAKSEIIGKEGVTALEDGFGKDDVVTGILRQVWVQVFPMDVKENLDEKRLRAQIKTRHKRKNIRKNNYYVIVSDDGNHPLMDTEVRNELIKRLPELPLIIVKMDDCTDALVIPDDNELVSIILEFYLMLEYMPYEPDKNRSRSEET